MIRISRQQDVTVVELGPSYQSLDAGVLEHVTGVLLTEATRAEPPRMVLDLSATSCVGSAFIELLVRAWKRLSRNGAGRWSYAACGPPAPKCCE